MSELITVSSIISKATYSCKYPSCKNSYYINIHQGHTNKKFHRFPKDPISLQAWKDSFLPKNVQLFVIFIINYANPNKPTRLNLSAIPHSPINSSLETTEIPTEISTQSYLTTVNNSVNSSVVFQPRVLFPLDNSTTKRGCKNETVMKSLCSDKEENKSSSVIINDHSYYIELPKTNSKCSKMSTDHFDKYSFLLENRKGILAKAGLSKKDLTPQEEIMYREHRNLKTLLKNERAHVNSLSNLYNEGRFEFIEESLNEVSKDFINSQLRNINKLPNGRRWTVRDKAFALSIYKRSPRLYTYFETLKSVLASIPFECGMIKPVLEHLKLQTESMDELDRCCTLILMKYP
ncbi:hypothetical protein NQ317_011581 [Molorchus minor]|uniref:THAP-type domain-containing protein n=1 Tax=Molorchus minor TaxID=1323400 RepID=A0ABQ9JDS4_9CUCU|nr:hypothetical protein NQ317_011581 [Molorchus minor]